MIEGKWTLEVVTTDFRRRRVKDACRLSIGSAIDSVTSYFRINTEIVRCRFYSETLVNIL